MSNDTFGFAAFRSRQQLAAFESLLKKQGIACRLFNTPFELGLECGFSIKFPIGDLRTAIRLGERQSYTGLIGFYTAEIADGRVAFKPVQPAGGGGRG